MFRKIQMKRGPAANLPSLSEAEIGFTTDTEQVFIGTKSGNKELGAGSGGGGTGPAGPAGPSGPAGPAGPKGDPGDGGDWLQNALGTSSSANRGKVQVLKGVDGVKAQISLTVTNKCVTSGDAKLTLDDTYIFIPLSSVTHNTTTLVADAIRATVYPDWVAGGTGATVTFTAKDPGVRTGHVFAANGTGVTLTGSLLSSGVNSTPDEAYICLKLGNDSYSWVHLI